LIDEGITGEQQRVLAVVEIELKADRLAPVVLGNQENQEGQFSHYNICNL